MIDVVWIGLCLLLVLLGSNRYGLGLDGRVEAYVRQFESERARVALRTVYYGVVATAAALALSLKELTHGDPLFPRLGGAGVVIGAILGICFFAAMVGTATESPADGPKPNA